MEKEVSIASSTLKIISSTASTEKGKEFVQFLWLPLKKEKLKSCVRMLQYYAQFNKMLFLAMYYGGNFANISTCRVGMHSLHLLGKPSQ